MLTIYSERQLLLGKICSISIRSILFPLLLDLSSSRQRPVSYWLGAKASVNYTDEWTWAYSGQVVEDAYWDYAAMSYLPEKQCSILFRRYRHVRRILWQGGGGGRERLEQKNFLKLAFICDVINGIMELNKCKFSVRNPTWSCGETSTATELKPPWERWFCLSARRISSETRQAMQHAV